jgi:hypothetical protein
MIRIAPIHPVNEGFVAIKHPCAAQSQLFISEKEINNLTFGLLQANINVMHSQEDGHDNQPGTFGDPCLP